MQKAALRWGGGLHRSMKTWGSLRPWSSGGDQSGEDLPLPTVGGLAWLMGDDQRDVALQAPYSLTRGKPKNGAGPLGRKNHRIYPMDILT